MKFILAYLSLSILWMGSVFIEDKNRHEWEYFRLRMLRETGSLELLTERYQQSVFFSLCTYKFLLHVSFYLSLLSFSCVFRVSLLYFYLNIVRAADRRTSTWYFNPVSYITHIEILFCVVFIGTPVKMKVLMFAITILSPDFYQFQTQAVGGNTKCW